MNVYFECRGCGALFLAKQERGVAPNGRSGTFHCEHCGSLVHHWAGLYSFSDWKYVRPDDQDEG